jgi:hypothetical protein
MIRQAGTYSKTVSAIQPACTVASHERQWYRKGETAGPEWVEAERPDVMSASGIEREKQGTHVCNNAEGAFAIERPRAI